jgi:predicted transcriptional regulator
MIVVATDLSKKMGRSVSPMESDRTLDDTINSMPANWSMSANRVSALIVTENGRTAGIFAELNVLRPYFRIHLCKER